MIKSYWIGEKMKDNLYNIDNKIKLKRMLEEYNHAMIQLREGYIPGPLLVKLSECDDNRIRKRINILIPQRLMIQTRDLSEEDRDWLAGEIRNLNILAQYVGSFFLKDKDIKEKSFNKILEYYKGGFIKGNYLTYLDIQINSDLYYLTKDIKNLESFVNIAKQNKTYVEDHRDRIGLKYREIGNFYYDNKNYAKINYEKGMKYGDYMCKANLLTLHRYELKSDENTISDIDAIVV